ncbi:hypothetical protein F511_10082 [Dorcoceras hygrometricum]|uniref:Uncharacterized protein n=1 Tax=Dorcoceras hygrometricum TaxID=472368 RepID=A0A2Z7ABU2_9LAMI|nr:hypothetical protein F511_10082 [Dorcoceras hygrometricum]
MYGPYTMGIKPLDDPYTMGIIYGLCQNGLNVLSRQRPAASHHARPPCSGHHGGALPAGPPPGPGGSNMTNLASNRGLTRDKLSLQVDAPAMLCRRNHLMVSAIVHSTSATTARALPDGPPPGPCGNNETNHGPNRACTKDNERWEGDARDMHKHTLCGGSDQPPVITLDLHAPATMAGALPAGPPPGPDGFKVTNLASNRGLTREKQSLQVDAPAMLCRCDHLMVSEPTSLSTAWFGDEPSGSWWACELRSSKEGGK